LKESYFYYHLINTLVKFINPSQYQGQPKRLHWLKHFKNSAPAPFIQYLVASPFSSLYYKAMIPIKDDNPTKSFPFFTIIIITLNIFIFIYQVSLGTGTNRFILQMALIPYEIIHFTKIHSLSSFPPFTTFFTSIFTHANLLHLGGNMLYLWIFGNNIEDALGHFRFLAFYFTCGIIATVCHIAIAPNSTVPLIGASGAIAGILGAYLLLYPKAGVHTLIFIVFFIKIIRLPAIFVLSLWFIIQLINSTGPGGGVAWFAHIGGFVAGFILIKPFINKSGAKS